jgi:hypothetical protein
MVDRLVRFFLKLQFGGCERVIEARRYGSLLAHEIANRSAQACNVMAKRREFGDDAYLELLSPIINLLLGLLLRVTITLLKEAEQFGIFAFDEFNVLVSQLALLVLDFAF